MPGESEQITGVIKDFGNNRNGDMDALLIGSANGDIWVRFPPHTASQIMSAAPKGSTVTALIQSGPPHPPGPAGREARYRLVQLQVSNEVVSISDIPPPPPAAGEPIELSGTVDSLITGGHGEVSGLVVNGYRIVLPPHLAHSIAPLLQQGKTIAIKGYERSSDDGFVNADKRKLVKPYRLTIDSTDYLL